MIMLSPEMIKKLPKVELHDHLDGSLRPQTIIDLAKDQKIELPETEPEKLAAWFHRGADRKSLALYLEGFAVTVSVMQTKEAIERIAYESITDLAEENVVYAEIRFAPDLLIQKGLNLEAVVEAALKGLKKAEKQCGVKAGLILCAMRDRNNSLEIAELAQAFRSEGVAGFDIAGDEYGHPPKKHLEAFNYIRSRNFNITIHAGEAFGPESMWQAIQICGAHRIGHGTRLIEDMVIENGKIISMGPLAHYIRDKRIPMELCLSSNVQTGAAASIEEHPFILYYRNNFRVMLCTDNRLMSKTNLSREFSLAAEHYGLGLDDFEKLTTNAMKSAFLDYNSRLDIIYNKIKKGYRELKKECTEC